MGILRHLQHWLIGRGPQLLTTEFVPETHAIRLVTVQVVKTGITPPLATSDRFREAKTEPLHPAGRLHMRR